MPQVRSDGQKQVIVLMREDFLRKIDASVSKLGYNDRASLIRDAVYQFLAAAKINVVPEDKTAPGRTGKGGRPKKPIMAVPGTGQPKKKIVARKEAG